MSRICYECQEFAMDFIAEYDERHPGEEMDDLTAHNVYQELTEACYTLME
jgi:hypothetical protein